MVAQNAGQFNTARPDVLKRETPRSARGLDSLHTKVQEFLLLFPAASKILDDIRDGVASRIFLCLWISDTLKRLRRNSATALGSSRFIVISSNNQIEMGRNAKNFSRQSPTVNLQPKSIARDDPRYLARLRERLVEDAPPELTALGNLDLLALRKTALFCSARCPGKINHPHDLRSGRQVA